MEKLSSDKVAQVLLDASKALRTVTDERDKLAARCEAMERREEARKLASAMHNKGVRLDVEYDELVTDLEKEAETGRFPVLQEAVELVAPNMGLTETLSDDVAGGGSTAFESYILGNVG
jgi:hypothetical protein